MNLEEKIDNLTSKFDAVLARLDRLESAQSRSTSNDEHLESNIGNSDQSQSDRDRERVTSQAQTGVTTQAQRQDDPVVLDASVNVQRCFDNIKESYARVRIPPQYKVNDSANGIKTECRPVLKVISKSARFAETGLKVLASIQDSDPSGEGLSELFTIFHAQINFLQAEYSNIVVRSTFDEDTGRIFRQFENNSQALSERSLANIRVAAEISSLQQRHQRPQRSSGRGDTGFFNRSRGGHRGVPSNRGFWQQQGSRGGYQDRGGYQPRDNRMDFPRD